MNRYRVYLLDADDTLLDFGRAERYAIERALREEGIGCGPEDFDAYRRINSELWADYEQGKIRQRIVVSLLVVCVCVKGEVLYVLCPFLLGCVFSPAAFLTPGALEVVRELSKRAKLVMVTNGLSEVQRSRVRLSGLEPFFAGLCISGELGFPKPDPRMVDAALEMAGENDRAAALLAGDSESADIACAHRARVDSCLYNPHDKAVTSSPRYVIGRLEELLALGEE